MPELTEQFLIKVSPEMSERIEKKYSEYLKQGSHITKSEFIRCLLNEALTDRELSYEEICLLGKFARDKKTDRPYSIWRYPFAGWENVFSSLSQRDLISGNKDGAYVISEKGEKVWDEIPLDQKKHLRVPQPR
jgi:hypothetical protein